MKKGQEGPDDLLQWMIRKAPTYNMSDQDLAQMQLTLSMAAIHTTTLSVADILSELAIRPNLVAELRAEIIYVLQKGSGGGGFQPSTHELYQMKLLDSVMRESQRVNPVAQRKELTRLLAKTITDFHRTICAHCYEAYHSQRWHTYSEGLDNRSFTRNYDAGSKAIPRSGGIPLFYPCLMG